MHSQINEINAEIKEINRGNNEIKITIKNKDHIGMLLFCYFNLENLIKYILLSTKFQRNWKIYLNKS